MLLVCGARCWSAFRTGRALAFACAYPDRVARVVAAGATFGEFPDPTPDESAARQQMHEHIARLRRLLVDQGLAAYAAADIDMWGSALGPDERRKMVGLQLSNVYARRSGRRGPARTRTGIPCAPWR
jgi:hypothetical protein